MGGFGTLTNFGSLTTVDPHLSNPYVQQFSLGIERRMPANSVVTIAYVGTKGTQLTRLVAINPLVQRPAPATSTADEVARLAQFQAAAGTENGAGNHAAGSAFRPGEPARGGRKLDLSLAAGGMEESVIPRAAVPGFVHLVEVD